MLWERGKAYGQDLRARVFAEADDCTPVGVIAEMLRVSISYVSKALSRRRNTGETTVRPQRCHVAPKLKPYHAASTPKKILHNGPQLDDPIRRTRDFV